jgi:hypothetical protein
MVSTIIAIAIVYQILMCVLHITVVVRITIIYKWFPQ